jgi:hypothetical protein
MPKPPKKRTPMCTACLGSGLEKRNGKPEAERGKCLKCNGHGYLSITVEPKPSKPQPIRAVDNHRNDKIGKAPFSERSHPYLGFQSTLDYLVLCMRGGMNQAIIMANYGPMGDERTAALLEAYQACRSPGNFELEKSCIALKIKPSEFVGMVTAGMSQYRLDYIEWIKTQELQELIEKSYEFAKADAITGWPDRSALLQAAGVHLAPKAAQVIIDNRDQSQTAHIGLPSFEDTLSEMEIVGQRRLPESSAVEVKAEEAEYAAVARD